MQSFTLAAIFLSSLAVAYPSGGNSTTPSPGGDQIPSPPVYPPGAICTPATYQCRANGDGSWGWDVCDTNSRWVNGGNCPSSETCVFNAINGSPYCLPTQSSAPGSGSDDEDDNDDDSASGGDACSPGKTRCSRVSGRWTVDECSSSRAWEHSTRCSAGETCTYGIGSGDAYCVPNADARVCRPGTYQCAFSSAKGGWGWEVCTVEGRWVWGGNCRGSQTCSFNSLNGSPYCI